MRKRAFTLIELLVVIAIIAILAAILFPVFAQAKLSAKRAASLSNVKQIQLSHLMYGADYDDNMPLMLSGTWGNLAAPRGNDFNDPLRTKTWVELVQPYIKNYALYADPVRGDVSGFFGGAPHDNDGDGISDPPRTHRNQNRLAMFGYNYMFLSPWPLCVFSEARSFTQAEDSASTVMLAQSQLFTIDDQIGYFMANAPGMWPIIAPHSYYCIVWDGAQGSGNWSKLNNPDPSIEASIYTDNTDGTNYAFTDGHAKNLKAGAAAAGTNYSIVDKNNGGFLVSGAEIIDKEPYIWNLDSNFFCENASTAITCSLP